jgi:hypothetical protein
MVKFGWGQQGPGGENFSGYFLKEIEILQKKIESLRLGENVHRRLSLGLWGFFPGKNMQ